MKVKFTVADLDALEEVYFEREGYIPANISHIPDSTASCLIGKLWHRMAEQIQKEEKKNKRN